MDMQQYILFTYPNCNRCDALKESLSANQLAAEEFNLTRRESKLKIREFLRILNRDDKGAIIIPTLIIRGDQDVSAVINDSGELEDWLRSKG